jgi:hypothetical protein
MDMWLDLKSCTALCVLAFACSGGNHNTPMVNEADGLDANVSEDYGSETGVVTETLADNLADSDPFNDTPEETEGGALDPRQALRDRSLYSNISFEEADSDGVPVGWKCGWFGQGDPPDKLCEVVPADPVHSDFALRIAPGVVVYQDEEQVDTGKHVWYDLFAWTPSNIPQAGDFYQFGAFNTADAWDVKWIQYGQQVEPANEPWYQIRSSTQPVAGLDFLRLCINNTSSTEDLYVDDLVVLEEDSPIAPEAHLLRSEHYTKVTVFPGNEESILWVPLPMSHGHQVPLYIGLEVEPTDLSSQIDYVLDDYGNLGARIHFAPEAQQSGAIIRYDSVVMVIDAKEEELAELFNYPDPGVPEVWLADTPVVTFSHDGINDAAKTAVAGLDDPVAKMVSLLEVSSQSIYLEGMPPGLDAVSAFETHMGSCTAFANLGAALGRAAGIPTRTIANYLVGMPQQTHSINEFYLGPTLGWRLVEPQMTAPLLLADYAVLIRIDIPEIDEGDSAMASDGWAYPGVPLLSLVRPMAGAERLMSLILTNHFPDCSSCDNMATYQTPLLGELQSTRNLFKDARNAWKQTLATWTTIGPDSQEQNLRSKALETTSTEQLQALLQSL